jgi:hypothetical protein
MVKHIPQAWWMFPFSSPERIEYHRNTLRFAAFGFGCVGFGLLLASLFQVTGLAR